MISKLSFQRIVLIFLAVAVPSTVGAKDRQGCTLGQVAELHVTMEGASPMVEAKVGGEPARFIVDTGAFFSLVTPRAAEKFKLKPIAGLEGLSLRGAVGSTAARGGNAASFALDRVELKKVDFLIAGDDLGEADGLLGQNILGQMDVEYDLANGVVRIFQPQGCEKAVLAYWAGQTPYSIVPIARTTPAEPHIVADARVNNLPIKVIFDTGAGRSVLKLSAAVRAGASVQDDEASVGEVARGIGRRSTDSYILPFDAFSVGDETIQKTRLRVAKYDFSGGDMLLGADFFLSHRVLVSPSQRRLYFTYNGGPVFRLDEPADRSGRTETAQPAVDPPAIVDAGALARRAAASAARRDYASAIADLDRAIALQPSNPQLFLDRAEAHLGAEDPAAAKADLDQALKLKPEFPQALVLRGYMHLKLQELAKADADFGLALKVAPDKPALGLQIAALYTGANRFEQAVAHYDAWIAANPKSFNLDDALNGRCWARALWGRQLDQALADCDRALRKGSKLAGVLDSRGMVRLRRGEFEAAIADYDAALKLQPKLAWSLYGRGLAKLKRGDAAGGAADIQAAEALAPEITERTKQLGLTEASVVVAGAS